MGLGMALGSCGYNLNQICHSEQEARENSSSEQMKVAIIQSTSQRLKSSPDRPWLAYITKYYSSKANANDPMARQTEFVPVQMKTD